MEDSMTKKEIKKVWLKHKKNKHFHKIEVKR